MTRFGYTVFFLVVLAKATHFIAYKKMKYPYVYFFVPNKKRRAPRIFALKNGNTKLTRFGYTEFAQTDSTQAKVGKINIV